MSKAKLVWQGKNVVKVPFGTLSSGELFYRCGEPDTIFMATEQDPVVVAQEPGSQSHYYVGESRCLSLDSAVVPIRATLEVEVEEVTP